jgi:hypothetical protein
MTLSVDEEVLRKCVSVIVVALIIVGGGSWIIINNQVRQQLGEHSHTIKQLNSPVYDGLYQADTPEPASHDMSHMSGM